MDNFAYYLKTDLTAYLGEWVAVVDEKIVAHGENAKDVYFEAKRKFPTKTPLLSCISSGAAMILGCV